MTIDRPEGEHYTHGFHEAVVAAHSQRTADDCAAFLLPHLRADALVLDVGCGPGTITVGLAHRCGEVVGLDAEPSILEQARQHAVDEGVGNVTFEVGSAYDLRWADHTFDVVYAHQVLQHLAEPIRAAEEFRRVLKPGGFVAVRDADFGTMVHSPTEEGIVRWRDLYHAVTTGNGGEADAGRYLLQWVTEAGFVEPLATSRTWTYATPESRAGWGELWAVRTTEGVFADQAIENMLATREELEEIAAAFRRWAARPDGYWSFIHGEVLATCPG